MVKVAGQPKSVNDIIRQVNRIEAYGSGRRTNSALNIMSRYRENINRYLTSTGVRNPNVVSSRWQDVRVPRSVYANTSMPDYQPRTRLYNSFGKTINGNSNG